MIMKFDLSRLVRANIQRLKPYSCARDEFKGREASVFLDANESPYNAPYDRYPDPLQEEVKQELAKIKSVSAENIFLGNGSDEPIDLLYRIFCEPRVDNVVAIAPTYGMYEVAANINDVEYRAVSLEEGFQLSADRLLNAVDEHTKLIWLCSPNNPTGNALNREEINKVLAGFSGIVVIDEAYGDFFDQPSFRTELAQHPNLIVLNTMSKAWASASIRLGMAFASSEIIGLMNKVKYPYNISLLTQQKALEMLRRSDEVASWVQLILSERTRMLEAVGRLSLCRQLFPTDANFFLVRVPDANELYHYLIDKGIVVRNRHRVVLCGDCLRITIGTPEENDALLDALKKKEL